MTIFLFLELKIQKNRKGIEKQNLINVALTDNGKE